MSNNKQNQDGQRWIFLRGLSRGRGHWADFGDRFAQQFPQAQFEFLDLPGNGERNREKSPSNIEDYVFDLRSKSRLLSSGPVRILALSLGGMIATEWGRQYPDEVLQNVLVCTSSAAHSSPIERFRLSNYPAFAPLALNKEPRKFEEILLGVIANNEQRRQELMEELVEYSTRYPASIQNFFFQIWAASRYRFPKQAPVPTLLVGSHGDRLVSPRCTLNLAQAWSAPCEMHPWAGHDIPVDDPQWLLDILAKHKA